MRGGTLLHLILLGLACTAPPCALHGQEQELSFPDGWEVRFDKEGSALEDLYLVSMPPGLHITTGPAMIAYHPDSTVTGDFSLESEVFLFDPGQRREAFGFFLGGSGLDGADQRYTYFLVRNGGEFLIKSREGVSTNTVQDWTAHPSIASWSEDGGGTAKNVLKVEAVGERLRFSVNGTEVWTGERGVVTTEGIFGLRVNHGLNLHVASLAVEPVG